MIELPIGGQWIQRNRGDMFGDLQGTFNLDFTKVLGKTRVTRMLQSTSQVSNVSLTSYPVGFKVFTKSGVTSIWTAAGAKVHVSASATPNSAFAVDATSSSPTDCDSTVSDIEVFGTSLYVSSASILNKLTAGGSWSTIGTLSGTSAIPHMMTIFATDSPRLYITDLGYKIYSMLDGDTSLTTSSTNTLTLSTNDNITFLRAASNRIWIGTVASSGKGVVYEWDGVVSRPTQVYRLESQGALACVIKDDVPWIVDTNGRLLQFSNGTFIEVGRLPLNEKLLTLATSTVNNRFIHPNGMTISNGKINLLINNVLGDNGSTINEFCPSGIWEYDDVIYNQYTGSSMGTGLYHKYSFSYTAIGTNTITDYGQIRVSGVGGLAEMKLPNNGSAATGNILAGAVIYTNASSTDTGTFTNDTFTALSGTTGEYNTIGAGYIVSTKQYAIDEKGNTSLQNTWQNIYTLYQKLLTSASKIYVKYRVVTNTPLEISITWTSTTTFTTTTNVNTLVGYEVEGTQGKGSGFSAHISQIDQVVVGATTTYTVTLDDIFTGVSGTAKVRIQNWKKISVISQSSATYDQAGIGDLSNWIQFKVIMLFAGTDELERFLIINANTLPPK